MYVFPKKKVTYLGGQVGDQAWKFSRHWVKAGHIGDPTGRNVEACNPLVCFSADFFFFTEAILFNFEWNCCCRYLKMWNNNTVVTRNDTYASRSGKSCHSHNEPKLNLTILLSQLFINDKSFGWYNLWKKNHWSFKSGTIIQWSLRMTHRLQDLASSATRKMNQN